MTALVEKMTQQLRDAPAGNVPRWLAGLRQAGADAFDAQGLPSVRVETWKYTSLRNLEANISGLGVHKETSPGNALPGSPALAADAEILMLDGSLVAMCGKMPDGAQTQPLQQALAAADEPLRKLLARLDTDTSARSFSALNNATLQHGLLVHVNAGVNAGRLVIRWTASGTESAMFNSRVCVLLDAGASMEVVEVFETDHQHASAMNVVSQFCLAADARLLHARSQACGAGYSLITRTEIEQGPRSYYDFNGLDLGEGLARHDLRSLLQGPGARCEMNGAYLPRGHAHVDYHLEIEHQAPACSSGQFFRGVLDDHGRAVFNGRVHVHPGADGTEARQSNANLLLSLTAEIDTKPELEIEADEVVASHGATVGQLDENAVFYLRSRGLDEAMARGLLTGAFCQAAVDRLPVGPVRADFKNRLEQHLGHSE